MQNYIHAFQVSTTSTCNFNDSSAAFITFYRMFRCHIIAARYTTDSTVIAPVITRLGCGGSNTNKTVCNSLLELMTVSAQLGFNSWGFNNSMHRYLQKKIQFILNQS
ncbi:hypothetical protein CAPTEDRAFT_217939 [Capitella teleta]|uniref:Uncharacterized protein n=1 Tax=Capitella teleta TaxID=283909 RepID=R7UWX4_CAPTE|nr:hypothetical protein CAPTEDRAFT_217939 [Capitella teleta]|eukprot:ELU08422.1 hypothetical protein CAPTEDRAFT_217939 [Capitella teleta]